MIERIKNNNKAIMFIFLLIAILLIIMLIYNDYKQVKLIKSFENNTIRTEYFNKYETEFEFIKNLIIKDRITYIGSKNLSCNRNKYQIKQNLYICSNNEIENIESLKNDIYQYYNKLRALEIRTDEFDEESNILFLIFSHSGYAVMYGFCISDKCSSEDETIKRDNYLSFKNEINEYWWSRYISDGER